MFLQSDTKNIIHQVLVTMFFLGSEWTRISVNVCSCQATAHSICPTSFLLFFTLSLRWIGMAFATPLFFSPSIILCFSPFPCLCHRSPPHILPLFIFVSYHPSILLAGWPKSCAVLELCSGRDKLSVAFCSHTHPLLSHCIDCMHEKETEARWGWGQRRTRKIERRRTSATSSMEGEKDWQKNS